MVLSFVKTLLCASVLSAPGFVRAENSQRLFLSKQSGLSWPGELGERPAYLMAMGAYFRQSSARSPFSILIRQQESTVATNSFSAARVWKENITAAGSNLLSAVDHGCSEWTGRHRYRCYREGVDPSSKNKVAEALMFVGARDLIYLRVVVTEAKISAVSLLDKIQPLERPR